MALKYLNPFTITWKSEVTCCRWKKAKRGLWEIWNAVGSWEALSVLTLAKIICAASRDILVCTVKAIEGWTDGFISRSVTRAETTKLAGERKARCCSRNKTSLPRWEVLHFSGGSQPTERILPWEQGWAGQHTQTAALLGFSLFCVGDDGLWGEG